MLTLAGSDEVRSAWFYWRHLERKAVPSGDEVAELIAEGTSAPFFMASGVALSVTKMSARSSWITRMTARALEPSSPGNKAGPPEVKNFNSLEVLTAPLSVENVAGIQGVVNEGPNKLLVLDGKKEISADPSLNARRGPDDLAAGQKAAKRGIAVDLYEAQKTGKGQLEEPSASGAKLVRNDEDKGPDGLTDEEHQKVEDLKRRDAEVRAHEQAHAAVGGGYAGAPRFRFVRGPDGKFYAVAGEVSIDTSAVPGNPQATIRKMQQVKRAALAPQEPSAQDRRVAAEAERKIMQARGEIREEENEQVKKAQEKKQRQEAEAQGFGRSIAPEQAPVFDPEARFRSSSGGTGPALGTGLVGAGGLDVDASDVIDPKSLFSMVA